MIDFEPLRQVAFVDDDETLRATSVQTLSLAGSLLSFLNVPPVWQVGAQGVILFLVLAGRVFIGRSGR